jgi:predicted Fe-Mo cluster-binding NifX family protein
MKVALPVTNNSLSLHFGHCEKFVLYDVSDDGIEIMDKQELLSPPHEPGALPKWLHDKGATIIIAGGMGSRAQMLFDQNNIQVMVGVSGGDPDAIVRDFLKGNLEAGPNACDH